VVRREKHSPCDVWNVTVHVPYRYLTSTFLAVISYKYSQRVVSVMAYISLSLFLLWGDAN